MICKLARCNKRLREVLAMRFYLGWRNNFSSLLWYSASTLFYSWRFRQCQQRLRRVWEQCYNNATMLSSKNNAILFSSQSDFVLSRARRFRFQEQLDYCQNSWPAWYLISRYFYSPFAGKTGGQGFHWIKQKVKKIGKKYVLRSRKHYITTNKKWWTLHCSFKQADHAIQHKIHNIRNAGNVQ